jgi:hypothetical protein
LRNSSFAYNDRRREIAEGADMADEERGTWLRPAAAWLAIACIILVLVNAALQLRNQDAQRGVNQRQQVINQAAQLARASQILIETIAKSAIANKDDALTAALERHGIKLNINPPLAPETKP